MARMIQVLRTKEGARQAMWDLMEEQGLADFPRPVHNRIPNFKGAVEAGGKISSLVEFQVARTVKVGPDKPQEEVRRLVLEQGKQLLVPTPRLRNSASLFNRISLGENTSKQEIELLASRRGIDTRSRPVDLGDRLSIDLVVVGSVVVDRLGHRVGKGEGFADLEFGLAASHGMVDDSTVVVTTVHDCQVLDSLPGDMFACHDLPVDIILTPSQVIRVKDRLTKPSGILWELLTEEKVRRTPLLQTIRRIEQEKGMGAVLKDSAVDEQKNDVKKDKIGLYFSNIPKDVRASEFKQCLRDKDVKLVFVRWKPFKQSAIVFFDGEEQKKMLLQKMNGLMIHQTLIGIEELKENIPKIEKVKSVDNKFIKENTKLLLNEGIEPEKVGLGSEKEDSRKQRKLRKIHELDSSTGLFISNIPRSVTKSDFMAALNNLQSSSPPALIDWVGRRGFARVFWSSPEVAKRSHEKLIGFSLQGTVLHVELFDPSRNIRNAKLPAAVINSSPIVIEPNKELLEPNKELLEPNKELLEPNMAVKHDLNYLTDSKEECCHLLTLDNQVENIKPSGRSTERNIKKADEAERDIEEETSGNKIEAEQITHKTDVENNMRQIKNTSEAKNKVFEKNNVSKEASVLASSVMNVLVKPISTERNLQPKIVTTVRNTFLKTEIETYSKEDEEVDNPLNGSTIKDVKDDIDNTSETIDIKTSSKDITKTSLTSNTSISKELSHTANDTDKNIVTKPVRSQSQKRSSSQKRSTSQKRSSSQKRSIRKSDLISMSTAKQGTPEEETTRMKTSVNSTSKNKGEKDNCVLC